jgi:hypothetical protein
MVPLLTNVLLSFYKASVYESHLIHREIRRYSNTFVRA